MYLSRVFIENFRSIHRLDLSLSHGKNVIVGRNNSGKSNIIRALDIVLGEGVPNYQKNDSITEADFYAYKETTPEGEIREISSDHLFVFCELTREPLEELNFSEMYKGYKNLPLYAELEGWDNKKAVLKLIKINKEKLFSNHSELLFGMDAESANRKWINNRKPEERQLENFLNDKYSFAFAFFALREMDGSISKHIRFLCRKNNQEDWYMSFSAPIRTELLQSAIIPSFREPKNQLRITNWSWFGKLLIHLTKVCNNSPELNNALSELKNISNKLFSEVTSQLETSSLNIAFPGTKISLQFNHEKKHELHKDCVIYVDDGFNSQITEKGSGIQSAVIIGLFNYYTRYVNTTSSALLCIEEPELYLHPHARRIISERLDHFLENNRNQVIITTHSQEFIQTILDDIKIILVTKHNNESEARELDLSAYKDLFIDSNKNEIFFAEKIIICEGQDEYLLRAAANELFPGQFNENNISIVSVGGKDNIKKMNHLSTKLGIKSFIFADFDYLLRDKTEQSKKYGGNDSCAHDSILNLGEAYFSCSYIFGDHGSEMYSRIQKMRDEIKKKDERVFYSAKRSSDCFIDLNDILSELRENGICILSGQIEDLFSDQQFVSYPNTKFNLKKVFELRTKLIQGESICDIIDVSEIKSFLQIVLSR